jgi:multidrug resistance efflux pump
MRNGAPVRFAAKIMILVLCALWASALGGCTDNPDEGAAPAQAAEKNTFTTCFGTVNWRESQALSFPFDIHIRGIEARNGQIVSAGDILFHVDYDELTAQKAALENALESLQFVKDGYEAERTLLQSQADRLKNAGPDPYSVRSAQIDLEDAQNRLDDLNAEYTALVELYDTYPSLYPALEMRNNLEAAAIKLRDQESVVKKCRLSLEKAQDNRTVGEEIARIRAQTGAKSAQIIQTDSEIPHAEKNVNTIKAIIAGQAYKNSKLIENGAVCIADNGYLIDNIYAAPNSVVRANEPVLNLVSLDSLEAVCYVEEQLVKNIRTGDAAQLSLYSDSTVIELGTVAFISRKAIVLNGETVVEVIIDYEGDNFLPGYNVVARITPGKQN